MVEAEPVLRAYHRAGLKIFVRLLGLMLASSSMAMAGTPDRVASDPAASDPVASPDSAPTAKPAPQEKAKAIIIRGYIFAAECWTPPVIEASMPVRPMISRRKLRNRKLGELAA